MPAEVHKLSFLHILASVVLVIGSLYWARAVFVPLALSLMLTFLLQPVVAVLHRRGLGYAPAAAPGRSPGCTLHRSHWLGGCNAIIKPGVRAPALSG